MEGVMDATEVMFGEVGRVGATSEHTHRAEAGALARGLAQQDLEFQRE